MTSLHEQLGGSSLQAARALLGQRIRRADDDGRVIEVRIVEVEAYDQTEAASQTFRGRTAANASMFEAAGTGYVYFTYGMHHCLNVVAGPAGHGAGVLLRAAEVVRDDHDLVAARRGPGAHPLAGPARLTQALGVTRDQDGVDLFTSAGALGLVEDERIEDAQVATGPRVGVRLEADRPWRLWIDGHPDVSRYRRHPKA